MRTSLFANIVVFLALLFSSTTQAQYASTPDTESSDTRSEHILNNLKYRIPQLREMYVVMGDISPVETGGFEMGSFTVNGQTIRFLLGQDDTLYILNGNPIDVSLSSEEIDAALEEERVAAEQVRQSRNRQLNEMVAGEPIRGNPEAAITIVEFSDFQCPYCSRALPTVEHILEEYPEEVKFVYLHYPLGNHPWAKPAAISAVCAAEQDPNAFWALHDGYFESQDSINLGNVQEYSRNVLSQTNIDLDAWTTCSSNSDSDAFQAAEADVNEMMRMATMFGVSGTPAFFVNGHFVNGAQPPEVFESLIRSLLDSNQSQ